MNRLLAFAPLTLGIVLVCPPVLAQDGMDRGAWHKKGPIEGEPPYTVVRNGWTIPGQRRRDILDRHWHVKKRGLKKAAKQGDLYDKVFLGDAYFRGHTFYWDPGLELFGLRSSIVTWWHSVRKSPKRAERWYRAAVAAGHKNTLPLTRLGDFLDERARRGKGDRDALVGEAIGLYRKAAEAGDPVGMTKLANALRREGHPKSAWRGWYAKASADPVFPNREARLRLIHILLDEGKDAEATRLLGQMRAPGFYQQLLRDSEGQSALRDYAEYRLERRLRPKAEAGDLDAMMRLTRLIGERRYPDVDQRTLTRWGAPLEDRTEYRRVMVYVRKVARRDAKQEYLSWLRRTSDAGHPEAMVLLADRIQFKKETLQPEAVALYRKAADKGNAQAKARLAELRKKIADAAAVTRALEGIVGGLDGN